MSTYNKRGVVMLWTVIIVFLLLVLSGSMATLVVRELHMVVDISSSTQAYSNAKTGVEWGTKYLASNSDPTTGPFVFYLNPTTPTEDNQVRVEIKPDDSTGGYPYKVISTGIYNSVRRRIDYTVTAGSEIGKEIVPSNNTDPRMWRALTKTTPVNIVINNKESFSLQYDFWYSTASSTNTTFEFGLDNYTNGGINGDYYIRAKHSNGNFSLITKDVSGNTTETALTASVPAVSPANGSSPYQFRAIINYYKGTGASLVVEQLTDRGSETQYYTCLGKASRELIGKDFGDLNSFSIIPATNGGTTYRNTNGESYISIRDLSEVYAYVDNIMFKGATEPYLTGTPPTVPGVIPTNDGGVPPVTYPAPSCTLTARRTALSTYFIDYEVWNTSSGSTSGGNSAGGESWITSLSGLPVGHYSGSIQITPHIGSPQSTYSMSVSNPTTSGNCSRTFNLWLSYPSIAAPYQIQNKHYPEANVGTDATMTNPDGLYPWNDANYATITFPTKYVSGGTYSVSYIDQIMFSDSMINFEPKMSLLVESSAAVQYWILLNNGAAGWKIVSSGQTDPTKKDSKSTVCPNCHIGLIGVDITTIDPSGPAFGAYDRVGIHLAGTVANQTVKVYGMFIYQ